MAIAYDTSGYQHGSGVASRSVSLAATGSDRVAIIAVSWFSATYTAPLTVTANGADVGAAIASIVSNSDRQNTRLYRLVAPSTSSVVYQATWAGNVEGAFIGVATYTGVDQGTPINGTPVTAEANDTAPTITTASASGEVVVAAMYVTADATASGGQTDRIDVWDSFNEWQHVIGEEAGAASVTQSWTLGTAKIWNAAAARLNPAGATASITPHADFYAMLRRNN